MRHLTHTSHIRHRLKQTEKERGWHRGNEGRRKLKRQKYYSSQEENKMLLNQRKVERERERESER